MTDSLNTRVAAWLQKQGFPLEMEAAAAARGIGFDVSQSDYYIDPEGGGSREIDLVLSISRFTGNYNLTYALFVECKSSRDKPWLLFSSPNELATSSEGTEDFLRRYAIHSAFTANSYGEDLLLNSMKSDGYKNAFPRIDSEAVLGHGMTQAFAEAGDPPFKAIMGATKAARSYVSRHEGPGLSTSIVFAAPIVLIDVPLLSVSLAPGSSELEIVKLDRGAILWKQLVANRSRIGVYIVTKSAFPAFLAECKASADWWLNSNSTLLDTVVAQRNGRLSGSREF